VTADRLRLLELKIPARPARGWRSPSAREAVSKTLELLPEQNGQLSHREQRHPSRSNIGKVTLTGHSLRWWP